MKKKKRSGNKHRISPTIVNAWKERYEAGETGREIADSIKQFGYNISHASIVRLIRDAGGFIRAKRKTSTKGIMLS